MHVEGAASQRRILHVGCGIEPLPSWLPGTATRFDIDPSIGPDVVGDMTAIGLAEHFDIVYCCHSLEHVYPHQVGTALKEFHRVLIPGGALIVFVPDLEDVKPTDDMLYVSPAGPITGLDLFYGFRPWLKDHPAYAHHTGFVSKTLHAALEGAGFSDVTTKRLTCFNLLAVGRK